MKKTKIGQTIAWYAALLFYIGAAVSLGALGYWYGDYGKDSPIIASLAASVVFFIGGGIVLHVIARSDLPDLRIGRDEY